MTWMAASLETIAGDLSAIDASRGAARSRAQEIDDALAARIVALNGDRAALARAHLERSLADELLGDGKSAVAHAESALAAMDSPMAHATLRRLLHARGAERTLLEHQAAELAAAVGDAARADRWAERGRLLRAAGADGAEVRAAFERALACVPAHPAALKGLEVELAQEQANGGAGASRGAGSKAGARTRDPKRDAALAAHFAKMAEAYADEAELAARLHVERAELLDPADVDAARDALKRAHALDAKTGVVREACIAHAARHREWPWLAELLEAEAALEPRPARAAALELDAACIQRLVLGRDDHAVALLERAADRAPTAARVDARVLDDLVLLYERAGDARGEDALRARRRRLAFVEGGAARAAELRTIAALEEARGDTAAAIGSLRDARAADPADPRAAETLDGLLANASRRPGRETTHTAERIALLVEEASLAESADSPLRAYAGAPAEARARYLLRASALAEKRDDSVRATELARAALVARPGDQAAVDALARLLASAPSEAQAAEARARIALHAHAAEHATDDARRVAHHDAVALLTEEILGDAALAVTAYEAVLAAEPGRRDALVGLARTARRAGDDERHVRALLDEAAANADPASANALRLEAATVLAASDRAADGDRALALTGERLERDPANHAARALEERIHERAGRWGLVDRSLATRVERARGPKEKAALLASRGELLRVRLRDSAEALRAFREAFALAPGDDDVRRAILTLLELQGDTPALRTGLLELAAKATSPGAAVDALARAAELDELVLRDDDSARGLLDRALARAPEDEALAERRARMEARRAREARPAPTVEDAERARVADPRAAHALRWLEAAARRERAAPRIASALSAQAETWHSAPARLGALFGLLDLVEWTLPASDPAPVLDAILALAPDDLAALDARARCSMQALAPAARKESGARAGSAPDLAALRRRIAHAPEGPARVLAQLTLALALDPEAATVPDASLREALGLYSAALAADPSSILAAHGAVRLGAIFNDDEAAIAGATALAEVTPPAERALRLTHAAARLLATRDPRASDPAVRFERATGWLEAALEANPDSVPAAVVLLGMQLEATQRDRLVAVLRRALDRATTPDAKVRHGTELARVARLDPPDHVLAIDALRRVVAAVPSHAPGWRALADAAIAQGASAEAAEALEALVNHAPDPKARLAALFDLAAIYRARPDGAPDVERVLRVALDTDPTSERAVRELLAARRAQAPTDEVTALLARLVEAVQGNDAKATVLGELADAHLAAGDAAGAERALIEASAHSPNVGRLARLVDLHPSDPAAQARALGAAVARGESLGRADPASLVRLGRLEIESLGRPADGVAHLRRALALSPTMHDARAQLARGLVDAGGAAEAISTIASMILPDASPLLSLPEPGAALGTLERAFASEGQADESLVARELRVIGGGLDDAAHVELRARRLAPGTLEKAVGALDGPALLTSVGALEMFGIALAIAQALEGVETKIARSDAEALHLPPRPRAPKDEPLQEVVPRIAAVLGLEPPPFASSDAVPKPRVALVDGTAWVVAPASLASRPPPEQLTALTRPLVRIALGVPWLDDLTGVVVHALLIATARRSVRDFASDVRGAEIEARIDEMSKRIARVLGPLAFKQRKALGDLSERLAADPRLDARAAYAFQLAIARTELRTAFVLSGDLLATLDALRAADAAFARETDRVGPRALAGTLVHPVGSDLVRFAMARQTTALRRRLGTTWPKRT